MHTISLTNGYNLTKLAQIHHQDGGKKWLDFGDLDLVMGRWSKELENWSISPTFQALDLNPKFSINRNTISAENSRNYFHFCFPRYDDPIWNESYVSIIFIAPACSRVRYRRPIFCPSVRLSTFMSPFHIYVKVSILINYKQPSNLAWNISLASWLCNIGVGFSVCLSVRPSICQHLCRSSTFMSELVFLINYKTKQPSNLAWNISLTSWLCDIGAHFSIRLSVRLSICPSLNSSVMSKFDIYVKVSILINYKTKQPSNLVWNISLTSWLCDIGACFSIRLSVRLSLNSSVTSKFDIYVKVSILINYNSTTTVKPCMTHLPDLLTWQICWPSDLDLYFALHWLWHNLRWRSRSSQL